jgi:anti-anti-sigma regulatory factor
MMAVGEWLRQVERGLADDLAAQLVAQARTAFHTFGAATTRDLLAGLLRALREDLDVGGVDHLRRAVGGLCRERDGVVVPFYDLRVLATLLRDALHLAADRTPGLERAGERAIDGWLQQMAFQVGMQFIVRREEVIEKQSSELEVQLAELQASHAEANRLLDLVRKVSLPILPVHHGVLAVPLIGTFDAERGRQLLDATLAAVARTRAEFVIFDITGVPVFDATAAVSLTRAIGATRLLGAELILVGVSAEVAQSITSAGLQLGNLVTRRGLQEGLDHAREQLELRRAAPRAR